MALLRARQILANLSRHLELSDRPDAAVGAALGSLHDARILSLDGIRGLAILMVVIGHASEPGVAINSFFKVPFSLCWTGVELFFVLSGFLITTLLFEQVGQADYFRQFYVRRILRIVPLFYVLLILLVFVTPLVIPDVEVQEMAIGWQHRSPWYFAFLSNILALRLGDFPLDPLAVSWSLSVEEQFYLVWPVVVLLLRRSGRPMLGLLGLLGAAATLRMALLHLGWGDHAIYVFTPTRMDPLIIGSMLAVLRLQGYFTESAGEVAKVLAFTVLGVILLTAAFMGIFPDFSQHQPLFLAARQLLYYPAISTLFGALLVWGVVAPSAWWSVWLQRPWLMTLGTWSYGIYLTHNFINHAVEYLGLTYGWLGYTLLGQGMHYLCTLSISILVGAGCYYLVERPCLRLRACLRKPSAVRSSSLPV
ncbi:MAG: acyltransferase [Proteobacteria bacterium]|nr:acyltransferase [Pseudomonadota bacterium]